MNEGEPRWTLQQGVMGLLVALAVTFLLGGVIAAGFLLSGNSDFEGSTSFTFAATGAQEIAFVVGALIFAAASGRVDLAQFGFRRFKASAIWWSLVAVAAYLTLAVIYAAIAHPPRDQLPTSFGVDKSVVLGVATGILVIGIAPLVEEFFFRGFIYKSFRNTIGIWPAALASGLIFGLIHLKFEFLFPLTVLGVVLALLHQRTGSLWPCVGIHAVNNAVAFVIVT